MARIEPVVPPAPGKFSTTNCCPRVPDMCSPATRAETSVPPPGANGTIIVIVRVGYACALTTRGDADSVAAPVASCRNCLRASLMVMLHELSTFPDPHNHIQ